MITTLAAMKRKLQVGAKYRMVHKFMFTPGPVDIVYTVILAQTNHVEVTGVDRGMNFMSRFTFPTKKDIRFTEKGWVLLVQGRPQAEYEWIEEKTHNV